MSSSQIDTFATQLRQRRASYGSLEETAAAIRREMEGFVGPFGPEMVANLAAALEIVRAEIQDVQILRRYSIVDVPEDWYRGPGENSRHWAALHEYLKTKGWDPQTIGSLDRASSEVVSLVGNPGRDKFACRGLVVGYVQSGKTANMTAVVAKSIDAGYNMIIVLGGVTNKLRKQTQDRFEKDVLRHRALWQLYTTSEMDGDFIQPANRGFVMPSEGHAQLVVMKKEGTRLDQLRQTITNTPAVVLRALRVLLIDDECDQASVNSKQGDFEINSINARIRIILAALPAVTYVGYTATPFANVFINPYPNGNELDDLYPRDFITALEKPIGYFGAREVFGRDSADDEGEERDMIRIVAKEEPNQLRPKSPKDKESFHPEITKSLEDAILWFLSACSIRRSRGQENEHMSMLVHVSPNVRQHEYMSEIIRQWIKQRRSDLVNGSGEATRRLREVFDSERLRTAPAGHEFIPETFETIQAYLPAVIDALSYPVENGETDDPLRLDYTGEPVTCIVVGGTVLARGLTLEGLCVSFFLRTSKQYDTLLQMGRWFGYRRGYEDLPRLWTTEDLASKFRSLAVIEEEIRDDIALYRENNLTPRDFAVKVRSIPGMAITAASKMKHALRTSMSFSGKHVQTIRFNHRDSAAVGASWAAASSLVDSMLDLTTPNPRNHSLLFREIPLQVVRRFLADVDVSEEHMDLKKQYLIRYLDGANGALDKWNVGIVQTESTTKSAKALGRLGHVNTLRRSRLKEASDSYADIKALMSKSDILIDAERQPEGKRDWTDYKACRPQVPLLLIYLINAKSEPQGRQSDDDKPPSRVALDAVSDLVGFGIVFPGQKDRSGVYFSVDIEAPAVEETEEMGDPIEEVDGVSV